MFRLGMYGAGLALLTSVCLQAAAESRADQSTVRATAEYLDLEILSSDSEFVNHIYLISSSEEHYIGTDDELGKVVSLPKVEIGEELVFEIRVHDDDRDTGIKWRSGPPSRNSDNKPHALASAADDGSVIVAFEDIDAIRWAADYEPNYSDAVFRLTPR